MEPSSSLDSLVTQLIDAIATRNVVTAVTVGLGIVAAVVVLVMRKRAAAPKDPPNADLK